MFALGSREYQVLLGQHLHQLATWSAPIIAMMRRVFAFALSGAPYASGAADESNELTIRLLKEVRVVGGRCVLCTFYAFSRGRVFD